MSPRNRETSLVSAFKVATRPTQLLISIQKYKTVHALGQQTWTALVDSLPVTETDVQKLQTTLESQENGGRWHLWQRSIHVLQRVRRACAKIMVKLCRQRCVHRVDVTCN